MANVNKWKGIWFVAKRLDLEGDSDKNTVLKEVKFSNQASSDDVMKILYQTFNIDNNKLLKLRNHRGSLIPINSHIQPTCKSVPYILEVVKLYQHVQPKERTVKNLKYREALKTAYDNFHDRLSHIEQEVPNMTNKRKERVEEEISDMQKTMNFLNQRLGEAEDSHWKGMFKRYPLW